MEIHASMVSSARQAEVVSHVISVCPFLVREASPGYLKARTVWPKSDYTRLEFAVTCHYSALVYLLR
jgi:hypothetical protein